MSTDFSIRPVGIPAVAPVDRAAPNAPRDTVRAQLPPGRSVTAADAPKAARREGVQIDRERLSRQMVFDDDSAQLIYRVVDQRTESVVAQVPDEAKRRTRAYFREMERAREASRPHLTDRTV